MPAGRVIGHSDIGICEPSARDPCEPASPKRLGRKSGDPGFTFPWERIEQLGLACRSCRARWPRTFSGGYFQVRPNGAIRRGDNDAAHRYGGEVLNGVTGAVAELQRNLARIGYFWALPTAISALLPKWRQDIQGAHVQRLAPNERGRWAPRSRGSRDAETCSRRSDAGACGLILYGLVNASLRRGRAAFFG